MEQVHRNMMAEEEPRSKLEERVSGTRHVRARHLCTSLPSELL